MWAELQWDLKAKLWTLFLTLDQIGLSWKTLIVKVVLRPLNSDRMKVEHLKSPILKLKL